MACTGLPATGSSLAEVRSGLVLAALLAAGGAPGA